MEKRYSRILALFFVVMTGAFAGKAQDKLYPKYPESFETGNKMNYRIDDIDLPTGRWRLDNAVIQNQKYDGAVSGEYAVRMIFNNTTSAYLQMMYDLPKGASKVEFWYKSFALDKPCMFQLEYSTDKGKKWQAIGDLIVATDKQKYTKAEMNMDIEGRVRFRINKIGLGDGAKNQEISNGRLNIDDFAVYYKE
ncbi:hypothetical protein [Pseudopedobacter sp.]|uniref:hypothetical protein n=1 Tax=Pseudopedobacter sp. TaxID=1936787 RepID=UPI00333F2E38